MSIFLTLNTIHASQREEQLTRVSNQLRELYGPLLVLTEASNRAFKAFSQHSCINLEEEWRIWIISVFMPINVKIMDLIISKADLLIEATIDERLLDFCAHVATYQAILKKWELNDFSEHISLINYPREMDEYCRQSFYKLKSEQIRLLSK